MAAFLEPHTVADQIGHHASVMVCPAGDGQPLIGFDEAADRHFAVNLQRTELAGEVHKMVCLLRFEFGFKRCIDAVNRLAVDLCRPRIRKDIKRATEPRRFKEGSELFSCLLHGFLNNVARGVSQLSLKRRSVCQRFKQFGAGERHLRIVHGALNLLIHIGFELLDHTPQFVFDASHLFDGRCIAEH